MAGKSPKVSGGQKDVGRSYFLANNVLDMGVLGMSIAAIAVVGQSKGRQNIADARKFTKSFIWLSAIFFVLMVLILLPLFRPLVGLFHPPAEIIDDIFIVLRRSLTRMALLRWMENPIKPIVF